MIDFRLVVGNPGGELRTKEKGGDGDCLEDSTLIII